MLGQREAIFRRDIMPLIGFGSFGDFAGKENAPPLPVQLQFLNAFGQRSKMAEELILIFASGDQGAKRAANQQTMADRADEHEGTDATEHRSRKPREVNGAAEQHRDVYGEDRNTKQSFGDAINVIGERDQEPGRS